MSDKDFLFGGGGLMGRTKTYEWWLDDEKTAPIYKKPEGYEGDWAMDWIEKWYKEQENKDGA